MQRAALRALRSFLRAWNVIKGRRALADLGKTKDPNEVYHFHLSNGGIISLHCEVHTYLMRYESSLVRNQTHRIYHVTAVVDGALPKELADKLARGLIIGDLLPSGSSVTDQKKAAIQAFVSLMSAMDT